MLKTRLMTAAILMTAVLGAIFYSSNIVWSFLAGFVTMIGIWEWANLIQLQDKSRQALMLIALTMALFIIYAFNTTYVRLHEWVILGIVTVAAIIWLIIVPYWLSSDVNLKSKKLLMSVIGLILLSATLISFLGLHHISAWLLLGVIAAVSIADSAAYFAGKCFGKNKLAPTISPGKTWEGVAGAFVAVSIYGVLLCHFLNYSRWLLVGLLFLVVLSIMGDLFESKLKRLANVKDSGQILPGHGGVLDRIDGLMPSALMTLFYIYLPLIFSNHLHI